MRTPRKHSFSESFGGPRNSSCVGIEIAFRVVLRYGGKVPTPQQLCNDFGMTKCTAYRWVRGMKNAKGLL